MRSTVLQAVRAKVVEGHRLNAAASLCGVRPDRLAKALGFRSANDMADWNGTSHRTKADVTARIDGVVFEEADR